MSRRSIAGVSVAVLGVGAVAAWSLWPREMALSQSAAVAPGGRQAASGRAAAMAKGPVAEIVLQVNGSSHARVPAGTPIVFAVSLTSATPGAGLTVGAVGRPWSADVRFEAADSGQPMAWRLERIGQAVTFRSEAPGSTSPSPSSAQTDVAVVDDSQIHQIEFALGPQEASRVAAGTYAVRAVLPMPKTARGETQLVSNPVTLIVEGSEAGAQPSSTADKTRLEAAARYYLRFEKWEDAHGIALQLVQRASPDATAFILLGDALNGLRRDEEALAAYREALAELPGAVDESPEYLIARMTEVEARLSAGKRGGGAQ